MNHLRHSLALTIFAATALGAALPARAADPDLSALPPASKQKGVTYAKDIKPLFEASCARCHGEDRPKGGLRVDEQASLLKGGENGKVIVPGKSEKSPLVIAVAQLDDESAMPPKPKAGRGGRGPGGPGGPGGTPGARPPGPGAGGPPPGPGGHGGFEPPKPLTAEQVGLVRAWIDQGAK